MQNFFNEDIHRLRAGYPVIGVNSAAFADADAVYLDTNGFLALATTSSKIYGYAKQVATMASDNQTVAQVKPTYVIALGLAMVYGADQAGTQTDIGAYADFGTVTSGAFELDLAAGATGQMLVVGIDPYRTSTTTDILVEVAEPQNFAFAQS